MKTKQIPNYSRYEVDESGKVINKQTKSEIKAEKRADDDVFRLTSDSGKRDYVRKAELMKLFVEQEIEKIEEKPVKEKKEKPVKVEKSKEIKTPVQRESVRIHINFKLPKQKYDEAIIEIEKHKNVEQLRKIADDDSITKTEKVRKLHSYKISKNAICILAKCRTGFIYNSLNDYMTPYKIRKKQKQFDQKKGEKNNEQ